MFIRIGSLYQYIQNNTLKAKDSKRKSFKFPFYILALKKDIKNLKKKVSAAAGYIVQPEMKKQKNK